MPLVDAPAATADATAAAAARWEAIARENPELQAAVQLQRQLIDLVLSLLTQVERAPLPRLSLPTRYLAAKLRRGVPVLSGEPVPLPVRALTPTLLRLCDALAAGGAGAPAQHIRQALTDERLDAGSLLSASIARDHRAIRAGAVQHGLAPDLLWLVAELATSPFVFALQRAILATAERDGDLAAALRDWQHGYCPACGSWPALAEVATNRTVLRCSYCSLGWERHAAGCLYCDDAAECVVVREPEAGRPHQRLQACSACSGYLKILEVAALSPFPFVGIGDLETMQLDMNAMREGLGRPQVREFVVKR